MKPWTETRNEYMKYHSKLTYQLSFWNASRKVDYHAGGKWFSQTPQGESVAKPETPLMIILSIACKMLTVRNSIHFWHTNGCSCESVKDFETENASTWEGLEPPTFGFTPNAFTIWAIRARHLLSHVFEHWLWQYRYFLSKLNIWNASCARATAFIFDTRMDVLVNVSKILRQKMFRPDRDSNPQPSDWCRML